MRVCCPLLFRGGVQPGSLGCLSHGVCLPEGTQLGSLGCPRLRERDNSRSLPLRVPHLGGWASGRGCLHPEFETHPLHGLQGSSSPSSSGSRESHSVTFLRRFLNPSAYAAGVTSEPRRAVFCHQSSVTTDVGQGRLIPTPVATGASPAQPRHPHFRPLRSWVSGREGTTIPCIREEVWPHKVDTEPAILP